MKIVIDIPEEVYKSIQDNDYCGISNSDMYNAIKNGTPLPKGHGDLISRQAVIDMLNKLIEVEQKQGTDVMNYGRERVNAYESILDEIESDYLFPSMPSAEKTTLSTEKTTINGDLISRQAVIQALKDNVVEIGGEEYCGMGVCEEEIESIVNDIPSAEKTARWKPLDKEKAQYYMFGYVCSKCGAPAKSPTKYCSNCGANMHGGN